MGSVSTLAVFLRGGVVAPGSVAPKDLWVRGTDLSGQ